MKRNVPIAPVCFERPFTRNKTLKLLNAMKRFNCCYVALVPCEAVTAIVRAAFVRVEPYRVLA